MEQVEENEYLGTVIRADGEIDIEINNRVQKIEPRLLPNKSSNSREEGNQQQQQTRIYFISQ